MPINYHVKKSMHCSALDPALQDSIQGCRYEREKIPEFKPMNRGRGNIMPKPLKEIKPIKPVTLGKTTNVSQPTNKGFSVFSPPTESSADSDELYHLDLKRLGVKENLPPDVYHSDTDNDNDNSKKNSQYIHRMKTNLKAYTESLSVQERAKAQMVRASSTAYKKGYDLAQEQLDSSLEESTRGWQIDRELSTKEGLVLTKGDQIRVAYRGTDLKNINDLATDAAAFAGVEHRRSPWSSRRSGRYGCWSSRRNVTWSGNRIRYYYISRRYWQDGQ